MMQRCVKGKAFTLIELLVVIAVIAVLAAILFPVFSQARRRAYLARCLTETRQIGQAALMYAQDYDETMPPVQNYYNPDANWGYLALRPYLRNDQVWDCPVCDPVAEGYVSVPYRISIDKRLNDWMAWTCRRGSSSCVFRNKSLAQCTNPVLFFIVSDRHWLGTHHVVADPQTDRLVAVAPMAFADGHIKAVRIYSAYDRLNWPIPYHWDFPSCHWETDPLLIDDYNRYSGL